MMALAFGAPVAAILAVAVWKAPRLTSVIVLALIAAILVSAALLLTLPGVFAEKARWLALAVPLIWVGFQTWCYADSRRWRPAIGLAALSLVSAALILTREPLGT